MRKLLLVAAAAGALALAGSAGAHVSHGSTSLTVGKSPALGFKAGTRVVIHGRLQSRNRLCTSGKLVRLFAVERGKRTLLARDRTDREGEYRFVLRPRRAQTVSVVFAGSVRSSYGHFHRCAGSWKRMVLTPRKS